MLWSRHYQHADTGTWFSVKGVQVPVKNFEISITISYACADDCKAFGDFWCINQSMSSF
jgi:hypothetical protein